MEIKQQSAEIIVKKEREKEFESTINKQYKDARSKFFTQKIQTKVNQSKATEKEHSEIISLFVEKQYQINLDMLRQLTKYTEEIQQLKQILKQIEEQYKRKHRECLPMQQIIKEKFTSLTLKIFNQCRYSISAFELFRVVHKNKLLHQVALKGVQVSQFQKFINLLNCQAHNKPFEQKEMNDLSWMKNFSPPNPLKLLINAELGFEIKDKDDTLSKIDDLVFFQNLFYQLSDIIAQVNIGYHTQLYSISNLQKLWECLRKIKSINIKIFKKDPIKAQSVRAVRSVLFGGLASFTEIVKLSFRNIQFSRQVGINDFLAMEQSLSTLFKNNVVTHLTLQCCDHFPVFPAISTLKSICLWDTSFRKQFGFIKEVTQSNQQLKCIKCYRMVKEWRIDEQLFNKLQTLIIKRCNRISFGDILSQSPSNIKHLQITNSSIGKVDYLSVLFPKLANLTCLTLIDINFEHQLLCTIPSTHLEELSISDNNTISTITAIDSKWPNISSLTLRNCSNLTKNILSVYKFKGLVEFVTNRRTLGEVNSNIMRLLKNRGIKVNYLYW